MESSHFGEVYIDEKSGRNLLIVLIAWFCVNSFDSRGCMKVYTHQNKQLVQTSRTPVQDASSPTTAPFSCAQATCSVFEKMDKHLPVQKYVVENQDTFKLFYLPCYVLERVSLQTTWMILEVFPYLLISLSSLRAHYRTSSLASLKTRNFHSEVMMSWPRSLSFPCSQPHWCYNVTFKKGMEVSKWIIDIDDDDDDVLPCRNPNH